MEKYLYNLSTDKYRGFVPDLIKALLFILSFVYGLAVRVLVLFYRMRPNFLSCKVISVGNITLGGTGKTALVEYIANYLKQQGWKVAVLSRGYKKVTKSPSHQVTSYETMGDEPYMLSQKLGDIPVIVDKDRIKGAQKAIKDFGVDTVILDDAFQQWRIKKDLEIVTIDSANPFGNRCLLPRGILREPLSALKRADIFVLTKTNLSPSFKETKDFLNRINPAALIVESAHEPVESYAALKNKPVTLFSGIGDPGSFEALVKNLGINAVLTFRFRDHHNYSQRDLDKIICASGDKNIDTVITTEKDAARLHAIPDTRYPIRIVTLRIKLRITQNEQEFHHRLLRLYSL